MLSHHQDFLALLSRQLFAGGWTMKFTALSGIGKMKDLADPVVKARQTLQQKQMQVASHRLHLKLSTGSRFFRAFLCIISISCSTCRDFALALSPNVWEPS